MDPVSLATAAITCIGALTATGNGIRRLYQLRHASEEILWLSNDLQSFRAMLFAIRGTLVRIKDSDVYTENCETLQILIERATEPLLALDKLLAFELQSPDGSRVSKLAWLRLQSQIRSLQQQIRDRKVDLAVGVGSLGIGFHHDVRELMMHVDAVRTHTEKILEVVEAEQRQSKNIPEHLAEQSISEVSADSPSDNQVATRTDPAPGVVHVQTSLSPFSCPASCRCRCHEVSHFSTPKWFRSLIGQILVSYNGWSILRGRVPCDYALCNKSATRTTLHYYFPPWLADRALIGTSSLSTLIIKFPLVVPTTEPVWTAVQRGDLSWFTSSDSRKFWNPEIIDEKGWSLLHHAVDFFQPKTYRMLLEQGANAETEDSVGLTPQALTLRWNVAHLFDVELSKVSQQLNMTPLHLAILGDRDEFKDSHMEQYYHFTNTGDRTGMTPLHWACRLGMPKVVRILLVWKADINLRDRLGVSSLHHACAGRNTEVFKLLIESDFEMHALNLDRTDHTGHSAIFYAMRTNMAQAVQRLIDLGASTHIIDVDGRTLLHNAALYASPEIMKILASASWVKIDPGRRDKNFMTADECFDVFRKECYGRPMDPAKDEAAWSYLKTRVRADHDVVTRMEEVELNS